MPKSRISYNIHGQNVPDWDGLKRHLVAIDPAAVLVMDDLDKCRELKRLLPDAIVIYREHGSEGDETVHKRMSPEAWLKHRGGMAAGGIWQYTTNEPGYDKDILQWHVWLMEQAVVTKTPLVVGNFATGLPKPEEWGLARRFLELLAAHPDLFILGLHQYAAGVATSGLYGGYPDNAGADPSKPNEVGKNLIPPEAWPPSAEGITTFHMGRQRFLLDYCKLIGIRPPRMIITETGFDDLSDVAGFMRKLKISSKYQNARGWKSIIPQWEAWFGARGWSPERAYFEQLKWADRVLFQPYGIEAELVFSWGHSSQMWDQFDMAEAFEFHALLEAHAKPVVEPPPPAPKPLPAFPIDFDERCVYRRFQPVKWRVAVRSRPTAESQLITFIEFPFHDADVILEADLRPEERVTELVGEEAGRWLPVRLGKVEGWIHHAGVMIYQVNELPTNMFQIRNLTTTIKQLVDELDDLL